ncbi:MULTISPECIES: PDR/VanB family oxidoreductase [unclassified Beijerinckia]|uniref:PDR/VanB family oxidoreductase n=1 Tax=unclassified Beijerinckia TaxID=2638183 RepID=UPI001FCE1807|nr:MULTISPECIES: PDR/VanB family oxidoreductase [unclassified Beijerinckia]
MDDHRIPAFDPGAHIKLHLPNGMARSYSLINPPENGDGYRIAVKRDAAGRGGSSYLHDHVKVGDIFKADTPANNFHLREEAEHSILVAGGIGITPIYAMAHRLTDLGRNWRLYYTARSLAHAALLESISTLPGKVQTFFPEDGTPALDLRAIFDNAPAGAHFYCCGPAGMLDHFIASATVSSDFVHIERFSGQTGTINDRGCRVKLARDGRTISVSPGQSILDALLDTGIKVEFSCREGLCGACETKVLKGIPDHRDFILDDEQRETNRVMMVCCSGATSDSLTLDL